MSTNRLRIGILGASGYTGAELVRLLARHPQVEIRNCGDSAQNSVFTFG